MTFCLKSESAIYPLKLGMNILGRQKSNDIPLSDPHVSRKHLSIDLLGDDTITLMDLGSSNGLFVNGKKVPNAIMNEGDAFIVGKTVLQIAREA